MLFFKSATVLALTIHSAHGGRVQTKYHQRFCYLAFSITHWALPSIRGGWQPWGFHLRIRHRTWNIPFNVLNWIEVLVQCLLSCLQQPCPPPCPVSPLIVFLSLSLLPFFPPLHLIKALQKLFFSAYFVLFFSVSVKCVMIWRVTCFCCCFTVGTLALRSLACSSGFELLFNNALP